MAAIADRLTALTAGGAEVVAAAQTFETLIESSEEVTWGPSSVPDLDAVVKCCQRYLDWLPDHEGGILYEISRLFIPRAQGTLSSSDRSQLLDAGRLGKLWGLPLRNEDDWLRGTEAWLLAVKNGLPVRRVHVQKRLTPPSGARWLLPMEMCFRSKGDQSILVVQVVRPLPEQLEHKPSEGR